MAIVEDLSLDYGTQPGRSVRLIVYMSHPHNAEVKLGVGEAMSANASIKDEMIVGMMYIKQWTGVLHWLGCPAEAAKKLLECSL